MVSAAASWTSGSSSSQIAGVVTAVASSSVSRSRSTVGIRSESRFPVASDMVKNKPSASSSSSLDFSNKCFVWHCMRRMYQRSINKEIECSRSASGDVENMDDPRPTVLPPSVWLDERRRLLRRRLFCFFFLRFRSWSWSSSSSSWGSLSRKSSINRSCMAPDKRLRLIFTSETRVWSPSTHLESVRAMFRRTCSSVESR
mmetsp:Transcript_6502/g.16193  ORF Transcript_6502/g.16193 Transcript_6502/m.16193 type:complete len:200 (+) Transcript_6502:1750-2349(+)